MCFFGHSSNCLNKWIQMQQWKLYKQLMNGSEYKSDNICKGQDTSCIYWRCLIFNSSSSTLKIWFFKLTQYHLCILWQAMIFDVSIVIPPLPHCRNSHCRMLVTEDPCSCSFLKYVDVHAWVKAGYGHWFWLFSQDFWKEKCLWI